MPRGRHRASFDEVSEFDRGRIVAHRDCGLSFSEIGQHVGRNQETVQSGMPARRPLLCLHLTGNHRRLRCQWCNERRAWTTE
ncbi:transposable element Tc1 transposase [Trichonephila clavipes]|nr:transposable element Tc1 transposase [Trichonephila clavipes]